jgi:predicted nucleic acid-binding protein
MTEFRFLDTNILLYLYDRRDERKRRRAAEIFRECWEARTLVISTQVIQEFYAAGTRKLGLKPSRAYELLVDLCRLRVVSIGCSHILRATEIEGRFAVSFWDALILSAAQAAGASLLYSEDLQHGQKYGEVQVQNPFQHELG